MSDGLNIGLSHLLADISPTENLIDSKFSSIDCNLLNPAAFQPRNKISDKELEMLVESIKVQGVLQPIIVRKLLNEGYEIIAGERRWRAAKLAGLETVPVIVKTISDQECLAIALIENIQRENLNPLDEAEALQKLHIEFNLTHEEVAKAVSRSRASVTNLMRLNLLSEMAKEYVRQGKISMGHARAILALEHDEQSQICSEIVEKGLSVRATEILVRKLLFSVAQQPKQGGRSIIHDPELERWGQAIANMYHSKVTVKLSNNGECSMVVKAKSKEELQKLMEQLGVE